jgi:hypothetical protein
VGQASGLPGEKQGQTCSPPIVEFVCEADVRDAIKEKRKIYIGPKTIVTPSARDLAARDDILVLT